MCDIGLALKEKRLARGLNISDIAKQTRINPYYLRAMEDGRFHIIPKVYDRGYLKIYANLLHMDTKPLLALYEEQRKPRTTDQSLIAVKSA